MDLEQLKTDLQGLSTMAEASRRRLAELAARIGAVRARLERERPAAPPVESPPSGA